MLFLYCLRFWGDRAVISLAVIHSVSRWFPDCLAGLLADFLPEGIAACGNHCTVKLRFRAQNIGNFRGDCGLERCEVLNVVARYHPPEIFIWPAFDFSTNTC